VHVSQIQITNSVEFHVTAITITEFRE